MGPWWGWAAGLTRRDVTIYLVSWHHIWSAEVKVIIITKLMLKCDTFSYSTLRAACVISIHYECTLHTLWVYIISIHYEWTLQAYIMSVHYKHTLWVYIIRIHYECTSKAYIMMTLLLGTHYERTLWACIWWLYKYTLWLHYDVNSSVHTEYCNELNEI